MPTTKTKEPRLKVGDTVMWRGAWGSEPPVKVKVTGMQKCPKGSKYGKDVNSATWETVKGGRTIVVDLDNNHWAYGDQLSPIK